MVVKMGSDKTIMKNASPYNGAITREQFLFYEVRTTAKLLTDGLSPDEITERVLAGNLFQYPTEKSTRRMVRACLHRLDSLNDTDLVKQIAVQPSETAKQICLYAMMKQYRLIWDFMITVVGDKYRTMNTSFSKVDLNAFFMRIQEQDDSVASWTDSTIAKLKQVLVKILVDNGYLYDINSENLNPVLLNSVLENAIRSNGDEVALPAFNCFD